MPKTSTFRGKFKFYEEKRKQSALKKRKCDEKCDEA
jgi:hypothetical protein